MTKLQTNVKWTNDQKIVWKTVENYTDLIINGEIEEFLKFFHADYQGWNFFEDIPISKGDVKNELSNLPATKVVSYKIIPVSIQIQNDIAIVHYYFSSHYLNAKGELNSKTGRYTDILIKDEKRWVLIGDHVGKDSINAKNKSNSKENLNYWRSL